MGSINLIYLGIHLGFGNNIYDISAARQLLIEHEFQ